MCKQSAKRMSNNTVNKIWSLWTLSVPHQLHVFVVIHVNVPIWVIPLCCDWLVFYHFREISRVLLQYEASDSRLCNYSTGTRGSRNQFFDSCPKYSHFRHSDTLELGGPEVRCSFCAKVLEFETPSHLTECKFVNTRNARPWSWFLAYIKM